MQTLKLTKKYEKYPEYKDSGVEWIGVVPKNWEVLRGKTLFKNEKDINKGMKNDNVLSLTMGGVINRDKDNNDGLLPSDYQTFQIFEKNDLVFKLIDLDNYKTSRVGLVHEKGIMSSAYIRLIAKDDRIIQKYFYYLYYHFYIRGIYNILGSGVRSTLNPEDLMNMDLVLPTTTEQENIVNHLDDKIMLLDKIIEKKERQIELLKEKRTANINHFVTRGFSKIDQLVESRFPWIGKIPKTWQVIKLKYLVNIMPSNIDKLTVENEEIVRLCNYVDVYKNEKITREITEKFMVASATQKQIEKFTLVKNDVILTKDSETPDDIGIPTFVPETLEGIVCGYHLAILRPNKINGEYLFRYLQSNSTKVQFFMSANGLTRYAIGIGDIGNLSVTIPSVIEQAEIQNKLEEYININNLAIKQVELSIEKLKELKTSLISNVVTGKIKV